MMNQIDMEENKYNEAKVYICIRGLWKLPVGPFIGVLTAKRWGHTE